ELAAEVHVEGDQRPPRADDDPSGGRMELRRAEVGRDLPAREPAPELLGPAAPEERRPAPENELALEEDRKPEFPTDAPAELERARPRPRHVGRTDGAPRRSSAPRRAEAASHELYGARKRHAGARSSLRRMRVYYDLRAAEYDDWWLGTGLFADRDRPGWAEEVDALTATLDALPPARTLDVACGTGFLTRHLPGEVVGLDQSASMLEIAQARVPASEFVHGDGIELPFPDRAVERLFNGHLYGHLEEADQRPLLA